MDPAKLKVVELRAELANLGLDTKGNKPALVDRLRKALQDQEGGDGVSVIPTDTTIADTSTEEIDDPPETPVKATRPGPASRTRRRLSSSEPPTTPSKRGRVALDVEPSIPEVLPEDTKGEEFEAAEVKQPDPPAQKEEPVKSDVDSLKKVEKPIPVESPKKVENPVLVESPKKVEKPVPVESPKNIEEKPAPVESPKKIEKPPPVESPKKLEKPAPIESPKKIEKPAPVEVQKPTPVSEAETLPVVEANKSEEPAEDVQMISNTEIEPAKPQDVTTQENSIESEDVEMKDATAESEENNPQNDDSKKDSENTTKKDDHGDDDDSRKSRDRKRKDRNSRWGVSNNSGSSDVQVTGEYYKNDDRSRDRHRSRSSNKRFSPRRKSPVKIPEPEISGDKVTLSWFDSDLNIVIDPLVEFTKAVPLNEGGFDYCWAGARASHGVNKGKICYEVRLDEYLDCSENTTPAIRIGWSTQSQSLHLGDGEQSWGFESTGRKVNNATLEEYGTVLSENDVIGVYLDLESEPCNISYTINGISQGNAFEFEKSTLNELPLFPHILTRNVAYKVNFGADKHLLLSLKHILDAELARVIAENELIKQQEEAAKAAAAAEEAIKVAAAAEEAAKIAAVAEEEAKIAAAAEEAAKVAAAAEEATTVPEVGEEAPKPATEEEKTKESVEELKDETSDIKMEEDKKSENTEDGVKPETVENDKKPEGAVDEENKIKVGEQKSENGEENKIKVDEQKCEKNKSEAPKPKKEPKPKIDEAATIEKFLAEHNGDESAIDSLGNTIEGYVLIAKVPLEELLPGLQKYPESEQCQVVMMCGLPGTGKTYWAANYATENADKRFNILGTNSIIENMKVDFKPFKAQFTDRWDILISKITKCVSKLIEIASGRKRNYILDQTNVYPSAQRRKMREFVGYKRTAVVIVPDETTYAERQRLREEKDGKDVPDCAVLEMKANFVLPEQCSWLEEVIFAELNEEEAKKIIDKYNKEATAILDRNSRGPYGGGPPGQRRSRFDAGGDRGRFNDRNRHGPPGPMRHRNDRRNDRRGGWNDRGRQDWNDMPPRGGWGGPRGMPYPRDNRGPREPPVPPFRGSSGKWDGGSRGGHFNRDNRGGGDNRRPMDRNDSDRNRNRNYGGSNSRAGSGNPPSNQLANKPRSNNPQRQNGPPSGGNNAGTGNRQTGGWSQGQGGNWSSQQGQGYNTWPQNWSQQQQGMYNQWSSGNTGSGNQSNPAWNQNWSRGYSQSNTANGQQNQQYGQWMTQGYWAQQPWAQGSNTNSSASNNSTRSSNSQSTQGAQSATTQQMWAQYAQAYAQQGGYAGNAANMDPDSTSK